MENLGVSISECFPKIQELCIELASTSKILVGFGR